MKHQAPLFFVPLHMRSDASGIQGARYPSPKCVQRSIQGKFPDVGADQGVIRSTVAFVARGNTARIYGKCGKRPLGSILPWRLRVERREKRHKYGSYRSCLRPEDVPRSCADV